MRLKGKRAFVTAAGAGIGRATAEAFAAEGAHVIATDIDEGALATLHGMTTRRLDVMDGAAIAAAAAEVGAVDILSMALNVKGNYAVTRAFLPAMIANGGGSIIWVASVASSIIAAPNRFVYGATKAAVIGMAKSIAADLVTKGIRSNAICPGTVDSPSLNARIRAQGETEEQVAAARAAFLARQPTGRFAEPREIATLAVYLASDESSFVTGQAIAIDGGWTNT